MANNTDRRDSVRIPMRFRVKQPAEGFAFAEYEGDLSLGGAYLKGQRRNPGESLDLLFTIPNTQQELQVCAEVVRPSEDDEGVHLRFVGLSTEDELAIARYIDDYLETSFA